VIEYTKDEDLDLVRKLDPYPEQADFLSDIVFLGEIREGGIEDSEQAYEHLSPQAYHEMFSDPRLEQEDVLSVDEESLSDMQGVLESHRPRRPSGSKSWSFRKGYNNSPSSLVEDPVSGMPVTEEILDAREDPFQDTDYVLHDSDAPGQSLPFVGSFQEGRQKALSDKFYAVAASEVKNRIGETEISVE
jgi:hypothetical protein